MATRRLDALRARKAARRAARRLRRARGRAARGDGPARATATSTRPRSGRRRPPPSCAPAIWPTAAAPTRRSRSISRRAASGSRSRCSTACAPASRSARCSATGSSAACTSSHPELALDRYIAALRALAPLDAITAAEHDLSVALRARRLAVGAGARPAAAAERRREGGRHGSCAQPDRRRRSRSSTPRRRTPTSLTARLAVGARADLQFLLTHRPGGFPAILDGATRSRPRRRRSPRLEPQVAAADADRRARSART